MKQGSQEWYDYIDSLVIRYQEGDGDSGMKLLEAFEPYIIKFARILQEGIINLKDRDSRKFAMLFIADSDTRIKLGRAYHSTDVRSEAHKTAALIAQLCSCMEPEDIDQELRTVFFTVVKRWKKTTKKANFSGYLYNAFRYELHRSLVEITKSPLTYKAAINVRFNEEEYLTDDEDLTEAINEDDILILVTEEDLDNSWIRGITCSDEFSLLTPLQRLILREHYVNGLSDQKIADKVGMHINTINKNRHKAITILREYYGD